MRLVFSATIRIICARTTDKKKRTYGEEILGQLDTVSRHVSKQCRLSFTSKTKCLGKRNPDKVRERGRERERDI